MSGPDNLAHDLRAALDELLNYSGGAAHALEDEYVIERARAALAKAGGGMKAIDRPHWAKIYEKDFFGQDGDQQLLTVTRESLRLAASALRESISRDAYHNSMAASREIEAVLKQQEPK